MILLSAWSGHVILEILLYGDWLMERRSIGKWSFTIQRFLVADTASSLSPASQPLRIGRLLPSAILSYLDNMLYPGAGRKCLMKNGRFVVRPSSQYSEFARQSIQAVASAGHLDLQLAVSRTVHKHYPRIRRPYCEL